MEKENKVTCTSHKVKLSRIERCKIAFKKILQCFQNNCTIFLKCCDEIVQRGYLVFKNILSSQ